MILGTMLVMFVPGFVWSYVFFDHRSGQGDSKKLISIHERIMWAFALSLAIVPVSFFIINSVFPIPVNGYTVFALMIGLSALGLIVRYVVSRRRT